MGLLPVGVFFSIGSCDMCVHVYVYTVSQKNAQTLKQYS